MSRTAQPSAARVELLNATFEAHATAHVMTSAAVILGDINFNLLHGGLRMAPGCTGSSSPAAVLAAGTVCHAGSVPSMEGTFCAVEWMADGSSPAAGRAAAFMHARSALEVALRHSWAACVGPRLLGPPEAPDVERGLIPCIDCILHTGPCSMYVAPLSRLSQCPKRETRETSGACRHGT